jgi:hypothetical protein
VPATVADGLARDAVRGDARASDAPYWWADNACAAAFATAPARAAAPSRARVAYRRGDPNARLVAERLVALSADRGADTQWLRDAVPSASTRPLVAAGLAPSDWGPALRSGDDAAYVVALPRFEADPCLAVERLVGAVPWISAGAILPLVDTRTTAIVKAGSSGWVVGAGGTVVVRETIPRGGRTP